MTKEQPFQHVPYDDKIKADSVLFSANDLKLVLDKEIYFNNSNSRSLTLEEVEKLANYLQSTGTGYKWVTPKFTLEDYIEKLSKLDDRLKTHKFIKPSSFNSALSKLVNTDVTEVLPKLDKAQANDNLVEIDKDIVPTLGNAINNILYSGKLSEEEAENSADNLMGFIETLTECSLDNHEPIC